MFRASITGQFLKNPLTTGAICASSPKLAKTMVSGINISEADVIVELGPGTGAITGSIRKAIRPDALFFAVELNETVITVFKERFPREKIYHDSASNLPNLLKLEHVQQANIILSGLPWASFPATLQDEILEAVTSVMPKNAVFATFAYLQGTLLPTGVRFKKRLHKYFSRVEKSPIVWRNIPPAFVYRCWK